MKRDHLCFMAVTLGVFIFSFGCAGNRGAFELVNYMNQGILNISELENRSLERYDSVTGKNFTTDQTLIDTLRKRF